MFVALLENPNYGSVTRQEDRFREPDKEREARSIRVIKRGGTRREDKNDVVLVARN